MTNLEIANLLHNVAAAYQLKDSEKYKFQIIAYDRAATAVEHATSELKDLWDDKKLDEVPGIGPSIASHLDELFRTGKSKHFDALMKEIPSEAFELMKLPKVGIKTAIKLLKEKSKSEIQEMLSQVKDLNKNRRLLLPYAEEVASEVMRWLEKCPDTKRLDTLGSLRRKVATIGDIDIAAASDKPESVLNHFVNYPKTQKIIEKGPHSASLNVANNVQVDLIVQSVNSYGSLLQHFTGSKEHNIALREYAIKKGLSLSEYGIKNKKDQKINEFKDEESFYKYLGLDYIEPELREDSGEIKKAEEHRLPHLISLKDIRSDLQIHSNFNIETSHDLGQSSMQEIIGKGSELGYEYLAFTEHNPSKSQHSEKEIVEILKRKREKVDDILYSLKNSKGGSVKYVFNSLEIDIMSDGNLPVPEEGLETLDFALVSIHSVFNQPKEEATKRVLNALNHPKVKIFAHPTGRKIQEREGVDLDWEKIFEFCLTNQKILEINADPMRLDLPDSLVRDAVKLGVKMSLGTDSHHKDMMSNMIYGVDVARRGWCEPQNVVNCLSLNDFLKEVNINI